MSAEPTKRFYKTATAGPLDGSFGVLLDGRAPRTPAGARLMLSTLPLAQLVAAEWEAQAPNIDTARMAATRLAFTAIDRVRIARAETEAEIVRYAGSDGLCYRADGPATLADRQITAWDPLLAWARDELGIDLALATGIVHRLQPPRSLEAVAAAARAADDFALAGLVYAAALFGSAVLALAVWRGRLAAAEAFDLSRLDEAFQEQQWGVDAEAAERTAYRRGEAIMIGDWFAALR